MQIKSAIARFDKERTGIRRFHSDDLASQGIGPRRVFDSPRIASEVLTAHVVDENATPSTIIASEQYRLMRTRVLQMCRSKRGNVFLVTSALAGEGKTMTSLNLSFGLAQLPDKHVLYVELDLRRPSAHTLLGIRSEAGAHTFLESERPWREGVCKLRDNLDALLAYNPSRTPNETLHKAELGAFLEEAAKEYDVVILDTAPLLATVDTQAILPLVSSVLFLIRADQTPIDCARDSLALVGDKVVGLVLNGAKTVKYRDYYYGYQSA